jgi:hypothetical protein
MVKSQKEFSTPAFSKNLIVIVGGYGSGKSEVAINLARHLAASQAEPVAIADLDIVNPYFRSREAEEELEALGIASLNPKGGYRYADLPIILPEIKGAIQKYAGKVIIDVGGDEVGTRVLSSLSDAFSPSEYELLLVVNANRPFTNDVAGCLKLMTDIETTSRLKLTGFISNTHLLTETGIETVLAGLRLAHELSERTGLPVVFFSAAEDVLDQIDPKCVDVPVLGLDRLLLKPWERRQVRPNGSAAKPGE